MQNVVSFPRAELNEGAPEMRPLIIAAKNLAWELKPDTPLFEEYTLDKYWNSLPREMKLRYIAGTESIVKVLQLELLKEQAVANGTLMFLQKFIQ